VISTALLSGNVPDLPAESIIGL